MAKGFGARLAKVEAEGTIPDGGYEMQIKKLTPGESAKKYYALKGQFVVTRAHKDNKRFVGSVIFPQYTIGNEEDPDAEEDSTWQGSFGAKDLKRLGDALGVDLEDYETDEDFCAAVKGMKVFISVIENTQTEGDYKGKKQNRFVGYYPADEHEPFAGIEEKKAGAKKTKRTDDDEDDEVKPKKAATKKAPVADDDDDEDSEEEETPKAKKAGRPKGSKNKPKPADDDDDEDEAPVKAKKKPAPAEDDDDEEEDEEPAPKPKKKAPVADDDDDEDADEDEDERPKKKRRG